MDGTLQIAPYIPTYWGVFKNPENNRSLIFDFCFIINVNSLTVEALSQQQPLEYCIDYE